MYVYNIPARRRTEMERRLSSRVGRAGSLVFSGEMRRWCDLSLCYIITNRTAIDGLDYVVLNGQTRMQTATPGYVSLTKERRYVLWKLVTRGCIKWGTETPTWGTASTWRGSLTSGLLRAPPAGPLLAGVLCGILRISGVGCRILLMGHRLVGVR